ncbi:MAG: hypothetical protein AABY22_23590, partial [Nanoarchaeota archaeon]
MNSISLNEGLDTIQTASAYFFSAQPLDSLGAVEYSLCSIVLDKSGSLQGYEKDLEKTLGEIVLACKKSPRADNLMFRAVSFDTNVTEINGFKLLGSINPNDYNNTIHCSSSTALNDAVFTSVEATDTFGKTLTDQGYLTNGIAFIVTDGDDNASKYSTTQIKKLLQTLAKNEHLESLTVVLIGVGDKNLMSRLDAFKNEVGITQFVEFGNITAQKLAKLANFVSKSISS